MKVGIIRCMQTEDYCPGTTDFKIIREKSCAFEGIEEDIEIVGFTSCGGCPIILHPCTSYAQGVFISQGEIISDMTVCCNLAILFGQGKRKHRSCIGHKYCTSFPMTVSAGTCITAAAAKR